MIAVKIIDILYILIYTNLVYIFINTEANKSTSKPKQL